MTEMNMATPVDIQAIFDGQTAGVTDRRRTFDLAARKDALSRLADVIKENEAAIIAALTQDFGKPETETILTEILPVLQEIKHARRHLRRWMRPARVRPTLGAFGTSARVSPEARGVCLIIAPWNYPFSLALGPLVSCLAAGNSAIIKPSEMTPATSALIARLMADAFPPNLVTVIEGAVDTSEALLALPFDHIFFTGSPAVGKIVMAAAAKTLASITLELGGKSPTIIGPEANLKHAADWIVFGKFSNAGQTCIAPDHLFVHASIKDIFTRLLRERMAKSYGSDVSSAHLAQIVNTQHADRLGGLLTDAITKGARVTHGGDYDGTRFAPTLIEAITPEMDIEHEEIFGPILPIIAYDDLSDVVAQINARPKPLSLYIFDKDRNRIDRIINETSSGSVGINLTLIQFIHNGLPFGGVNNSGLGNAHGHYGFRAFSHERAVMRNHFSALPLVFAPYTTGVKRLIDIIKRVLG
tara:strand:- start:1751 stop:3163 length:1413 start_codon:yes stop_codon:yes gene_type:complete